MSADRPACHVLPDARQAPFGDYFKDRAIELAWNLVTPQEFGLPRDRLLVTVYAEDEEAAGHWKKDRRAARVPA